MKKHILMISSLVFLTISANNALPEDGRDEDAFVKKSETYSRNIPIRVIRQIEIQEGYHEGLFIQDGEIWVNNGRGGNTWVIELSSGKKVREITSIATFTEGTTRGPDGKYVITDWDSKMLYTAEVEDDSMKVISEISFDPSHPTGVVWTGESFYMITWLRGFGTKYGLVQMDKNLNIVKSYRVKHIVEPSQIAWDGKFLWITSWFDSRVFKIDVASMTIIGSFRFPGKAATGIAWDGRALWVTGTRSDLYQIEVLDIQE